jgi:hypothetical protein
MRTPKSLAVCLAGVCLAMVSLAPPAAAQNVPFKVYVTELWQLDSGVDPGIGLIADYYARVTINGVELDNDGACDDGSLTGILVPYQLFRNFDKASECGARTPWVFSRDVPANQPVTVKIQIFDSDTAFDDEADLKPGSGSAIELTIDPATGQWSGDIAWPQQCSRPNLDLGSNNANVCWQIGFDADEDGLLDVWERSGADTNGDGTIDLDLASLGASPLRKDAFVEIDFLADASHSHGPLRDAVEDVVAAFANAPVANPDGTTGIQLHVDVGSLYGSGLVVSVPGMGGVTGTFGQLGTGGGDIIPEAGNEVIQQFGETGDGTPFLDLKAAHFASTRVYAFRYTIFGHQTNVRAESNDCTSGQAHRTRREFFVTLGGVGDDGDPCWGADSNGFSIGSIGQQGGTLMHELGHTLGLRHGGNVETNDKPNYLSVMNYSFQRCIVPASPGLLPGGCDYSRLVNGALLPDLDERSLDECVGVGAGMGEQDFDGDDVIEGVSRCEVIATNVRADTNNDGVCITAGSNGRLDTAPAGDDVRKGAAINDGPDRVCNTAVAAGSDDVQKTSVGSTPSQDDVLRSFDDWGNVTLSFFEFTPLSGSGAGEELEADPRTLEASRQHLNRMTAPGVVLDLTGPSTAVPGDTLSYSTVLANSGKGPALSARIAEVAPDGATRLTDAGIVTARRSLQQAWTYTVPATACPGDLTGASASVTFASFAGDNLTAADAVPLQIRDVSAPTFTLSVSPSSLWPPNHTLREVTATIDVTDNCDPSPAVQLLSITSNEPETGFLGNGDRGPDIEGAAVGTDDRTFSLRAERATGRGHTGRVYTIVYRVTDRSGNATDQSATVVVPTSARP